MPTWRVLLGDKTAAVAFILSSGRTGTQQDVGSLGRVVEIVHRHGLPVIVDAAGELPPRRHIAEILATDVDLICFSGGKDIHGPNDTGFLFGKLPLLEIAHGRLICPHHQVVRAMKATKEDVVAAVAALKRYMALDEPARYAQWEATVQTLDRDPGRPAACAGGTGVASRRANGIRRAGPGCG